MQALIHDLEDFLASHVVINYNAFMVNFLKEQGVLSDTEASGILATGAVREGQRVVREDKRALRTVGVLYSIALCVLLFGGLIIQLASTDSLEGRAGSGSALLQKPSQIGFLRVVANPWAKVVIDGDVVETTPFASPITLSPGVHYVELINPYFKSVTREIEIQVGKTYNMVETLALDSSSPSAEGK